MPIVYESAAPIGLAENIYNQQARREAMLRNQQMAAQVAASRGSYGGGGGGGDIQDAINHRDDSQARNQAEADQYNLVPASQVFAANAARSQQQQQFQLQAQLQNLELTQSEQMRMQRMKNAVGEVSADPSLSDQEKSDMILQLKTGIDPLAQRQAATKVKADQQLKEQEAQKFQWQAAAEKQKMDTIGKTTQDRGSFVADPTQLANITADLNQTTPSFPSMTGGEQARQAFIAQQAQAEALRQGLGTHFVMDPDGKLHPISGPGSKAFESQQKGEGGTDKGQMNLTDYLKIHQHAMDAVDRRAKETKEGDIPGTKVPAHPELADPDARIALVKKMLGSMGAPQDVSEFQAQQTKKASWGYDRTKSPWFKPPATVATPGQPPAAPPDQKPFDPATGSGATRTQTMAVSALEKTKAEISNLPGMDADTKRTASFALDKMKSLYAEYGSPQAIQNGTSEKAKKDWETWKALDSTLAKIMPKARGKSVGDFMAANPQASPSQLADFVQTGQAAPPQQPPAAWWQGGGQ